MQPLAYFAARALFGWLQYVERGDRAFLGGAALLVATGAAHCWAVVYALFIAIHTRAMRYDGYHEGYVEHLPFWVNWTETLAIASMAVWWLAGFATAAIRILDDDAGALPVETRDLNLNVFVKLIRSARLHDALSLAHTMSCVGLFSSIVLLCFAMALMKGFLTACELCLCAVSVGFALPHAVVAGRRLRVAAAATSASAQSSRGGAPEAAGGEAPAPGAEAAAQEAAALGPQLCVILALADSPGHAFLWQKCVYVSTALAFVTAVAACGRAPPRVGDAALPPERGESFTCLALDAAAAAALVVCFPHLNTWHLWLLAVLFVALLASLWIESWRDLAIELLDPLFVVRSDTDKALPGEQRQRLRRISWVATLACAAVALWDILLHPIQEGLLEPGEYGLSEHGLADAGSNLLLRWRPLEEAPDEEALRSAVASALGLETSAIVPQVRLEQHRLFLFSASGADSAGSVAERWAEVLRAPGATGALASLLDAESVPELPAALNVSLCLEQRGDGATAEGAGADARAAYKAACNWWLGRLGLDMDFGALGTDAGRNLGDAPGADASGGLGAFDADLG
eukprot:TRINITY_DN19865_c0_g1_i2.p1 TRINITY_DN19865_c0_g1~~TRINITY_DN19865_c0_g1_i2.p1  ORF type:complete len:610 (+),score=117.83 TRINITY_DN19865_c0_g1_i2:110-1831(+)